MKTCDQCGNNALILVDNKVPLCLQCYSLLKKAVLNNAQAMQIKNLELGKLRNEMDANASDLCGLPRSTPKYDLTTPNMNQES